MVRKSLNSDLNDQVNIILYEKEQRRRKLKIRKLKKKSKKTHYPCSDLSDSSDTHFRSQKSKKKFSIDIFIESEYQATLSSNSTIKIQQTEITRYTINNSINVSYVTDSDDTFDELDSKNDEINKENSGKDCDKDVCNNEEETISSYFSKVENGFYEIMMDIDDGYDDDNDEDDIIHDLELPNEFKTTMNELYDINDVLHVESTLNSARYWNVVDTVRKKNILKQQMVIIGSCLEELIHIFNCHTQSLLNQECPMDIVYLISQLVGDPVFWLRVKPGLNIFKWSATIHLPKKDENRKEIEKDEWYFSGYIGLNQDTIDDLKLDTRDYKNKNNILTDLDWCFVIFLLLGVIPIKENDLFRWYFNQKVLSALPTNTKFDELYK